MMMRIKNTKNTTSF